MNCHLTSNVLHADGDRCCKLAWQAESLVAQLLVDHSTSFISGLEQQMYRVEGKYEHGYQQDATKQRSEEKDKLVGVLT